MVYCIGVVYSGLFSLNFTNFLPPDPHWMNVLLSVVSVLLLDRRVVARVRALVGIPFRVRCSVSLSVVRVVWVCISVWLGWEMKSPPM